jgi:hypothetical protein
MTLVSQTAYAKHAQLSQQRISDLVMEGLPARNGRIDKEAADTWRLATSGMKKQKLSADLRLADLKLREREGSLVQKGAAETFVFEEARKIRDQLIGWVAQSAPTLAHELEADPQKTFAALDRLVREFLSEAAGG